LVVVGSIALLALVNADSPRTAWTPADATVAKSAIGATAPSSRVGVCILKANVGALLSSPLDATAGAESTPDTSSGGGSLTVSIPPVVFIRARHHRLVVTTNTGKPPQPQDTFYYIAHGTARLARPGLRQRVLTKCADQGLGARVT
jgi:hypothetical protein